MTQAALNASRTGCRRWCRSIFMPPFFVLGSHQCTLNVQTLRSCSVPVGAQLSCATLVTRSAQARASRDLDERVPAGRRIGAHKVVVALALDQADPDQLVERVGVLAVHRRRSDAGTACAVLAQLGTGLVLWVNSSVVGKRGSVLPRPLLRCHRLQPNFEPRELACSTLCHGLAFMIYHELPRCAVLGALGLCLCLSVFRATHSIAQVARVDPCFPCSAARSSRTLRPRPYSRVRG